jgi:hypothetical protein
LAYLDEEMPPSHMRSIHPMSLLYW